MLDQGHYAAEAEFFARCDDVSSVTRACRLRELLTADYDAAVCYFYSYSALAALFARMKGRPVIVTGGAEQLFRDMASGQIVYWARLILFWLCLLSADRLMATSTSDYVRMRELAFFKQSAIELCFHGAEAAGKVDPSDFAIERPVASLITICGMDSHANPIRKGVYRAIDLLAALRENEPSAHLVVIGRGRCAERVRDYAVQSGCGDAVTFTGYVPEAGKVRLLRGARYYLQLSDYEGFGIGALEALALGCQVIHSNRGGLRDTMADYGIARASSDASPIDTSAEYKIPDWPAFLRHMAQFTPERRTAAILEALRLSSGRR